MANDSAGRNLGLMVGILAVPVIVIPALILTRGSLRQRTDPNSNVGTTGPGGCAKELTSLEDPCGESLNRTELHFHGRFP